MASDEYAKDGMQRLLLSVRNREEERKSWKMTESQKNRACWNCWYDEFCDWHPADDEDACEEYIADEEG